MLQAIRDRSQGLIVGFIVFLISLTFVLVGIQGYFTGGSEVVVAEIDGDTISLSEFQTRLQQLKRRTEEMTGSLLDVDSWTTPSVKRRTLDQLIDERILDDVLDDSYLRISDGYLASQVREIEAFREGGVFSRETYERMLDLNGLSVSAFEKGMRRDLVRSQLRTGLLGSEFVTEEESMFIYRLQRQKRDIGFTVIPPDQFSKSIKRDDNAVRAHFEKNKEKFRKAERVSLQYLETSVIQLMGQTVDPSKDSLRKFYEDQAESYEVLERRKVAHLLLSNSASLDSTKRAEIVHELLRRLNAGESFDTILAETNKDYKIEGGITDFFEKGMMAPEFEEVAFHLKTDQISKPFTSKFGVHIVKLVGIEEGYTPELETIYDKVLASYKASEAEKLFIDVADRLSELSYENSDSLKVPAEILALDLKETNLLTKEALADLFDKNVVNSTFEPDVLVEGLNSEPVELADGRLIVVRVKSYEPSIVPEFKELVAEVEADWISLKEFELVKSFGETLLESMRSGRSVAELTIESALNWEVRQSVERTEVDIHPAILKEAFAIAISNNNPVYFGLELDSGDYAVVRVANVLTPSADTITEGEAALTEEEILKNQATVLWDDFSRAQRLNYDVEIYEDRL